MATISLEGSIRTCKVDSGWASKLASDRYFNPSQMLCPVWNSVDVSGRPVCADSYGTKTAGCNSASDRIIIENSLRPQYSSYVTLDMKEGLAGDMCQGSKHIRDSMQCANSAIRKTHQYTGQYGNVTGFRSNINGNCASCKVLPDREAYQSNSMRRNAWTQNASRAFNSKRASGF